MKANRDRLAARFRLAKRFELLRHQLQQSQYADRLDQPLANWASANDRWLPWALLGRTLRSLLDAPFDELLATPSVGPKKAVSLVELITRAAEDASPTDGHASDGETGAGHKTARKSPPTAARFNPLLVTEVMWGQWRETVRRHSLSDERLGRLVPSLQSLPTVMWHTPLSEYLGQSLAQIRDRKTHGVKRVRAILETFYCVQTMLSRAGTSDHLGIVLVSKFIPPLARWVDQSLNRKDLPRPDEVRRAFIAPLVQQLHTDARPLVARLAEERLGLRGAPQKVRHQAKRLNITRARVYQLLEECGNILAARWPEGRCLVAPLEGKIREASSGARGDWTQFHAAAELFFPTRSLKNSEDDAGE